MHFYKNMFQCNVLASCYLCMYFSFAFYMFNMLFVQCCAVILLHVLCSLSVKIRTEKKKNSLGECFHGGAGPCLQPRWQEVYKLNREALTDTWVRGCLGQLTI